MRFPRPAVARYYVYRASGSAAFTLPIFVLFFQHRGLSLAEVGAIEAAYTLAVLLAETPTGYVGDRLGHRRTVVLGALLSAAGAAAFTLAHTFAAFLAVIVVRALAGALRSGAESAWLYETLDADDESEEFARVSGRASALGLSATALAAVLGGVLYSVDRTLPWLVEAGFGTVSALALVGAPDAPTGESEDDETPGLRRTMAAVTDVLAAPVVAAFVLGTAAVFAAANTAHVLLQPAVTDLAGVDPTNLGVLYAVLSVTAAVAADRTGAVRSRLGVAPWFLLAPGALAVLFVAGAVRPLPVLVVLPFVLSRAVSAVSGPLANQYLNDEATTTGRATTLSAAANVRALATAPANVAGGALAATALPLALGGIGALFALGALLLGAFALLASQ